MKRVLLTTAIILIAAQFTWGFGNEVGVGYIAKAAHTPVYSNSTGLDIDDSVQKDFPFVAFKGSSVFFGGIIASESISDGRLHVRYWKNGRDRSDGENTAWLDPADVTKIRFDCCGDPKCSGIKATAFETIRFSECFTQAVDAAIEKNSASVGNSPAELEKLKLQLEIEKLKLEQERLKANSQKDREQQK